MKLTKYCIVVNVDNEEKEFLLINTLNGCIDLIDKNELELLKTFEAQEHIIPETQDEKDFYRQLLERKYILEPDEEKSQKEKLIERLRLQSKNVLNEVDNITFVLSYACNFKCPYCYERNVNDDSILTEEMVDAVANIHKNIKYISLFGGEPLLERNRSIIQYLFKRFPQAIFSITTNGYNLIEFFELLKSQKIYRIQITIDGQEEIHNKTRVLKNGKGTYKKIIDGVALCLNNKIPVTIRMNLSSETKLSILNERKQLQEKFKDFKQYLKFEIQPQFQMEPLERLQLENELIFNDLNLDDYNTFIASNEIMATLPSLNNFFLYSLPFQAQYNFCYSEGIRRFYDSKGDIYTCILAVGNQKKRVGTFFPNVFYEERSMLNRNIETIEKCRDCNKAFICGGGCANIAINQYGDAMEPCCDNVLYNLKYRIPYLYNLKKGKNN